MITSVLVDGVAVNNTKRFIVTIKDAGGANIDINSYARGGRDGVALAKPFYRGMVISMEWFIIADSASDLVTQREEMAKIFRLKVDRTESQTKRLGFTLANGVTKEIPVVFTQFKSDISPDDIHTSRILVQAQSELEYMYSATETTLNLQIFAGSGMPIPMPIPMNFAAPLGGDASVANNQGNAEYYPTIVMHGTLGAFDLKNTTTDKTFSYSGSLGADDYLTLDFYNRTAVLNGVSNVLANVSGDWWWLGLGHNTLKLTTSSGDGYAEVKYRNAYKGI